jgi:hypothetical protein
MGIEVAGYEAPHLNISKLQHVVLKSGAFEAENTRYSVFGLFFVDRVSIF